MPRQPRRGFCRLSLICCTACRAADGAGACEITMERRLAAILPRRSRLFQLMGLGKPAHVGVENIAGMADSKVAEHRAASSSSREMACWSIPKRGERSPVPPTSAPDARTQCRRAGGPPHRVHIGVHLGDIIFDDSDIYGDGVSIAARIEHAKPGSVAVSVPSRQCRHRLTSFEDTGERALKNIDRPVQVYNVDLFAGVPPPCVTNGAASPNQRRRRKSRRRCAAVQQHERP